jgi:DNA-binding transcriptional regulator YhcF (GntR family)
LPVDPLDALRIDRNSELPLATQLGWRLRTLIATEALAAGQRLPGVRELAEHAGVNVNTVRGVLARLEEDGLITSQHGRGTFVAARPPIDPELARLAQAAMAQARSAGVDPHDLAAALFVTKPERHPSARRESGGGRATGGTERERRRALRAEIASVEGELALLEGPTARPVTRTRGQPGRILSSAELEEIRDGLRTRLDELRGEREEMRRERLARRAAEEEARREDAQQAGAPAWRNAGQWTGGKRPRVPRVVWTPS